MIFRYNSKYGCPYCRHEVKGFLARLRLSIHMMIKHSEMYINNEWID